MRPHHERDLRQRCRRLYRGQHLLWDIVVARVVPPQRIELRALRVETVEPGRAVHRAVHVPDPQALVEELLVLEDHALHREIIPSPLRGDATVDPVDVPGGPRELLHGAAAVAGDAVQVRLGEDSPVARDDRDPRKHRLHVRRPERLDVDRRREQRPSVGQELFALLDPDRRPVPHVRRQVRRRVALADDCDPRPYGFRRVARDAHALVEIQSSEVQEVAAPLAFRFRELRQVEGVRDDVPVPLRPVPFARLAEVHMEPRVALVDAPRGPRAAVTDAALDSVLRDPLRRLGLRAVPRVADDLGERVAGAVQDRRPQVRGVPGVVGRELP